MKMELITQKPFNSIMCDVWQNDENEVFMTREQIGQALEYAQTGKAIAKIHERNKDRLDKQSVVTKLTTTDGKQYKTTIYNERGIYEIIRFSKQEKADAFYDFVYDLLEGLRKGSLKITQPSYTIDDPIKRAEQWIAEQKEKQLLTFENRVLEQRVSEYEPKANYVDQVLKSRDLVNTSQIAHDYGMSAVAFNKLLQKLGVQYKMNQQWLLYSKHAGEGYTKSVTNNYYRADNSVGSKMQTKWTQKGRLFLYELLKGKGIFPSMEEQLRHDQLDYSRREA